MKTKRVLAIVLLFFLGFWALLGGYQLMTNPTGESLQIPLDYLKDTPYEDYLIPGIILFLANGVSSLVIGFSALRKVKNYPFFIMVQGTILLFWLTAQLILNLDFYTPFLHISCYLIAFFLMFLGMKIKEPKADNVKPLES